MAEQSHNKPPMTPAQKRLLGVVIGLGAVLLVMFIFVMGVIIYQLAHMH